MCCKSLLKHVYLKDCYWYKLSIYKQRQHRRLSLGHNLIIYDWPYLNNPKKKKTEKEWGNLKLNCSTQQLRIVQNTELKKACSENYSMQNS